MNTMNLPGFTAENSLCRTSEHYHINSDHLAELNVSLVQPSLAIHLDGRFVCNGQVTDEGFILCDPIGGSGDEYLLDRRYMAQCRARCYKTTHGAALKECLTEC